MAPYCFTNLLCNRELSVGSFSKRRGEMNCFVNHFKKNVFLTKFSFQNIHNNINYEMQYQFINDETITIKI